MPEAELPHLRLARSAAMPYRSPRGGPTAPAPLPERDRAQQAAIVLSQIEGVKQAMSAAPSPMRPPDARGHLVAAEAEAGYVLKAGSLGDKPTEVVVVAVDSGDETAIIHVRKDDLSALERKLEAYADPSRDTPAGNPRNQPLIAPIQNIRMATIEDISDGLFTDESIDPNLDYWVELWVQGGKFVDGPTRERIRNVVLSLVTEEADGELAPVHHFAATERDLYLVRVSGSRLRLLTSIAPEVYRVRPAPAGLRDLAAYRAAADLDLAAIAEPPDESAATVVVLDTGVAELHPLLRRVMRAPGVSVVVGKPEAIDEHGHGTGMAGVAAFPTLSQDLLDGGPVRSRAWIRNARLIDGLVNTADDREFWPERTENAIVASEQDGELQVFNMSVGARNDDPGQRTSWSVAVDSLAHNDGRGRLIVVACGSIEPSPVAADYPSRNLAWSLDDPAQALNAVSVGALTRRTELPPDGAYDGLVALAGEGELSPYSACNLGGARPIKPEVVVEGGNCAPDGQIAGKGVETLSIITTGREFGLGRPLDFTWATSPAAASVSGLMAAIWAANPELEPHSVRGLMVHSARWSAEMRAQFTDKRDLLRAFGYGEPDLARAGWSTAARPTALYEGAIRPRVEPGNSGGPQREVHFFEVPLPSEAMLGLADHQVHLAVTLSFFVEPNETGRQYPGAMLRWDMQGPVESEMQFRQRINKLERDPNYTTETSSYSWDVGPDTRSRGSVQSDRCTVPAANLAGSRLIAVYPTLGWWENRQERAGSSVRYSLAVSVDCGDADLDLYAAIENALSVDVDV